MHDHSDHNQTLVPESFLVLHTRNGLALPLRAEIETCHGLCERVALHAAAFLSDRYQESDDSSEAPKRCHDGLRSDGEAFAPAEAAWIVLRVAELQGWAQPAWLSDTSSGADRSGCR